MELCFLFEKTTVMLETAYYWSYSGKKQHFTGVLFRFEATWWPTSLRATLDLPNGWKPHQNWWTDYGRPSQNHWWTCWFVCCALEFLLTDFVQEIANEKSCRKQFLTENKMIQLSDPPYSLELAPSDFILFPQMKKKFSKENVLQMWKRWRQIQGNHWKVSFGKSFTTGLKMENTFRPVLFIKNTVLWKRFKL